MPCSAAHVAVVVEPEDVLRPVARELLVVVREPVAPVQVVQRVGRPRRDAQLGAPVSGIRPQRGGRGGIEILPCRSRGLHKLRNKEHKE